VTNVLLLRITAPSAIEDAPVASMELMEVAQRARSRMMKDTCKGKG
jgi:hypothetical protein